MLGIAVCDDTKEEYGLIVECASVLFEGRQMAVHIDTYEERNELIEAEQEYDLYLLDVLILGLTGIETAARPGKRNHVVVFITSPLKAAVGEYSVNAVGFVPKSMKKSHFEAIVECVVNQYLEEREACISAIHNCVPVHSRLERIAWFENRLHRIPVTLTSEETLAIGQKLSELQEELKEHPQFLHCHQSYVVDLEQVERLKGSCLHMGKRRLIPTFRNFYKQSKSTYYHRRPK